MGISRKTEGVILAAGMGKRLGGLTADLPKALIRVAGAPLLDYCIALNRAIGIGRIVVVGGYRYEFMRGHVEGLGDASIRLVENKAYDKQRLLSLIAALETVDGDVLQCDVDYIFTRRIPPIIRDGAEGVTVYCVKKSEIADPDVMCVRVDATGNVAEMSKTLDDFQYVYAGIFFCGKEFLPQLKEASRVALERYGADSAVVESAINVLAEQGVPVRIADLGACDWVEVDTPEELARAERFVDERAKDLILP